MMKFVFILGYLIFGGETDSGIQKDIAKWDLERIPFAPIEISFGFIASGRDLKHFVPNADVNPKLTVFFRTPQSDLNQQSTEIVPHNSNPDWMRIFLFLYDFGEEQDYEFKVTSIDSNGHEVRIGEVKVPIDKLYHILNKSGKITLPFKKTNGSLILEKVEPLKFKLAAANLAKADTWGGKSDPYVKCFWSRGPGGPEAEFFRTAWVPNVEDAEWVEVITFEGYQKGAQQYFHFKVYDDDGFTSDDFLGEAFLNIDDYLTPMSTGVKVVTLKNEPRKNTGRGSLMITFV